MKLSKTKVQSEHFIHPFFRMRLPDPLSDSEKEVLISRIRNGSVIAAQTAVMTHLVLALNIVGRYITALGSSSQSDELVSSAVDGLCCAVQKIAKREMNHNNLTGYVTEYMHRYISESIEHSPMVRVPARTKRDRRQKGLESSQPATRQLTEAVIEKQFDKKLKQTTDLELKEIVDRLVQSDLERSIIELRVEGRSDLEVANQLGMSNTTVYMIRRELQNRFLEEFGNVN